MAALLCAQCNAPLSMEAGQGRAPCGYCGVLNTPSANPYAPQIDVRPRAVQMFGQEARQSGHKWICSSCRKENEAHYKFCLGCGAVGGEREGGGERRIADAPKGFPLALSILIGLILIVGALGLVTALLLAR